MSLPPILYHLFPRPLPYTPTLLLQHHLHALHLSLRPHNPDVLLLLQHRPVYTAGRREKPDAVQEREEGRLKGLGAEWVGSDRGGLTTYHGPGQLVGYPLFDLGRMGLSVRCYVDRLQLALQQHLLQSHSLPTLPPSPARPGIFLTQTRKLASIGVSVRHRLTTHGFSLNITPEPLPWFAQVVACGLEGVSAGCVQDALAERGEVRGLPLRVEEEARGVVRCFGEVFGREMQEWKDVPDEVRELERLAEEMGDWSPRPKQGTYLGRG